jgi:hypothetical protein
LSALAGDPNLQLRESGVVPARATLLRLPPQDGTLLAVG